MMSKSQPPQSVGGDSEESSLSRRSLFQLAGATASFAGIGPVAAQSSKPTALPSHPGARVNFTINGEPRELTVDLRQSLLDVLRERLDLTGAKKGCNQGACGACTVLVNGKRILSCLTLAVMHSGARIDTIEGLEKDGTLHPLQQAFVDHDGLQCGFCTSGQIMSGLGCISEGHASTPDEIRYWMSGNICRCGAYPGIVAAIDDASRRM